MDMIVLIGTLYTLIYILNEYPRMEIIQRFQNEVMTNIVNAPQYAQHHSV